MLFLVDEVLNLNQEGESIKQVKLKGKYNRLQDALRFIKPSIVSRKLTFKNLTLNEELEYFINIFKENRIVVYFYDSRYRSGELLERLQNWLLPDKILWPIPISGNKAEYLFFLNEVIKNKERFSSYTELSIHLNNLRAKTNLWILSPSPMKVFRPNQHSAIYKHIHKKKYILMEVLSDRKVKIHETGYLESLWNVFTERKSNAQIWTVSKGIEQELPHVEKQIKVNEQSLPGGIPYIHVLTME